MREKWGNLVHLAETHLEYCVQVRVSGEHTDIEGQREIRVKQQK